MEILPEVHQHVYSFPVCKLHMELFPCVDMKLPTWSWLSQFTFDFTVGFYEHLVKMMGHTFALKQGLLTINKHGS
jgi:hypothetical protein